ncbi:MAG: hypothetical protein GXP28_05815 [Planctomycetes bacterium]|nr:hypothetical protein [Planctomycetota bacterium]
MNNDCVNCPAEITVPATSVSDLTGRKHDLQASLISLLGYIEKAVLF